MKRICLFLAGAAAMLLSLASCSVHEECKDCNVEYHKVNVGVSDVTVSASFTKVTGVTEAHERRINTCDLYIFNADGAFNTRIQGGASGNFEFFLPSGTYDFYAYVNAVGLPSNPVSANDLLSTVTNLADNSHDNLQMGGSLCRKVIQSDETFSVEVKRFVSKMTYKIRTAFPGAFAGKPFNIEEIFLTNVNARNNIGLSAPQPANGEWINKMNVSKVTVPSGLVYGSINKSLGAKDSIETGHTFYCYPNPSSPDDHGKDVWSARCTRFVIKATLDGKTTYYPVTVPNVTANKRYFIDVTITNYGVDHPEDVPGVQDYVQVVITIPDWDDGGQIIATF